MPSFSADQRNADCVLNNTADDKAMEEHRDGPSTMIRPNPVIPTFTAVNQTQVQLLTPKSSATAPLQQSSATCNTHVNTKRHRHPAIAKYLGLGSCDECPHSDDSVLVGQESLTFALKAARGRPKSVKGKRIPESKKINQSCQKEPQKRLINEGFRVRKSRKELGEHPKAVNSEAFWLDHGLPPEGNAVSQVPEDRPQDPIRTNIESGSHVGRAIEVSQENGRPSPSITLASLQQSGCHAEQDGIELDWTEPPMLKSSIEDEGLNEDLDDADFFTLPPEILDADDHAISSSTVKCSSSPTNIGHNEDPFSNNRAAITTNKESSLKQRLSKAFISPVTRTTQILAAAGDLHSSKTRKPIARSVFPQAVDDRSPVIGLSSNTVLRTCFRIGEAISQAHQASKLGQKIVIELYARIFNSGRGECQQSFTFYDLFHARPPYVKGTYQSEIWKSVQLHSYDSQRLLQPGRLCRCIGKMDRLENEWVMTVMNIWEATWEDVKWVEGIINS